MKHISFANNLSCSLKMFLFAQIAVFNLQAPPVVSTFTSKQDQDGFGSAGLKSLRALALLGAGVSGLLSFAGIASADEAEHGLACPNYPWPHEGILSSYDHSS